MSFKAIFSVIMFTISLGSAAVGFSNKAGASVGLHAHIPSNGGIYQRCNGPLRLRGGSMSFLAAYMLLKMGGKESPTKEDMKGLLNVAGAKIDEDLIDKVVNDLNGKDINELLEKGKEQLFADEKLISAHDRVHSGDGGEDHGESAAAESKADHKDAKKGGDAGDKKGGDKKGGDKKEEKKAEKVEEKKDEDEDEDMDMGFGLFD